MTSLYKTLVVAAMAMLFFASCDDEYGPRKESTPVIESAVIAPLSFNFGDSVVLTAKVSDPATTLSTLSYQVVTGGKIITSGNISINGSSYEMIQNIFIPLVKDQPDNAQVTVTITVNNVLKGTISKDIDLTGKRAYYNQLYLVTDDGQVSTLTPQVANKDQYEATGLTMDRSFSYKIAEKITTDKKIDYSGKVWGDQNGKIAMIDADGNSAFAYTANSDYTQAFMYDNYTLNVTVSGGSLGANDFVLDAFAGEVYGDEAFKTLTRNLEKDQEYNLFGKLADDQIIYNPDFFERTVPNKVKFLGETGTYTLYYNPVRKNFILGVENPSYPDYLLACGWGLGYPTKVTTEEIDAAYTDHKRTHTDWGFEHILKYVLLRKMSNNVYQGTFYTPGDHDHYASFKPFEGTGWENEKPAGMFTFTGESIISGNGNWDIPNGENDPIIPSDYYRFTIDLNTNTVNIEKITL